MARIAGVDLPKNKRGEIGLTYIYGIGPSTAKYILDKHSIDRNKKVQEWNDDELTDIRNTITEELPVRGQRTKTNSRTRKGKRKTVAGKKKAAKK